MQAIRTLVLLIAGFCAGVIAMPGIAASTSAAPSASTPTVQTLSGKVQGLREDRLLVFKGVPYAKPPIGDLRWRAPQPVTSWQGTRSAVSFGHACIQEPGAAALEGSGDPGPLSEDCLTLNIWTPSLDAGAKRPVMVWIHGGAFVFGAGSSPLYDGTAMAQRGAVMVTLNYRMGALGFFAHPAISGTSDHAVNFGLLDQIAALRWVQQNIAAFGGDPHNVTVFGESAGGQSVLALFASPLAHGLFQKGIVQSAYGISGNSMKRARQVGIRIASTLGLDGAQATAAQLRAIPAERFERIKGKDLSLAPGLVGGDDALPTPILATFQRHREAALPLIIGNNSDEASVAVAFGIDPARLIQQLGAMKILVKPLYPGVTDPAQLGRETVRDVVFTAFARRIAYLHAQVAPTWRYYFSYLPQNSPNTTPGVQHGGEIPFVLGTGDRCHCLRVPLTDADRNESQRVGDYWFSFAATSMPASPNAPSWPRDSAQRAQVIEFGNDTAVRPDFMKVRLNAFIGALNVAGAFSGGR